MKENTPKLEELDVKGRDIEGLKPKNEMFSRLEADTDWKVESVCSDLESSIKLEDSMFFINPSNGDVSLKVEAPHWRSITQEEIMSKMETELGTEYFYEANVKGCGYLKPTLKGCHSIEEYDDWHRTNEYDILGAYGLADRSEFFNKEGNIISHTKYLIEHGLRTEMYGAWGKLRNLYYQGKKISVQELRDLNVIPNSKDLVPAIGLRFLKTNTRAAEFTDQSDDLSRQFIANAFETFNRESVDKKLDLPVANIEDKTTHPTFFSTFLERMGRNLAVLNNLGYSDWHLHSSNITMAAEIADIGVIYDAKYVKERDDSKGIVNGVRIGYIKDMRDTGYTIATMLRRAEELGFNIGNRNELYQSCLKGFEENVNSLMIKSSQKAKSEDHVKLFSYIMKRSIVDNSPLPSIKKVSPSDWKIE